MEAEEGHISVWVCREEKLISGLSKRTTCADVVRVLLEEQSVQPCSAVSVLAGSPESYCIVEKWRGFERILPNKTKILRLWGAWGDEQENVRFVLVKQDASLPNNGPRSAEARVVASKESPCVYQGTAWVTVAQSQEKQRRIVRKAFRKLEKINKKRTQALSKDKPAVEKMETLVHLIVSQDHTIRQQIRRIHELDLEIDQCEAKVHFDRVKTLGTNYVQDTYLFEKSLGTHASAKEQLSPEVCTQLEEYSRRCEEVLKLQEELSQHETLLDSITAEITDELNQRWMERRKEQVSCADPEAGTEDPPGVSQLALGTEEGTAESSLLLEEERIKTQLDTSLYIGLRLNTDLETIRGDFDLTRELWAAKERELKDLMDRVGALDLCAGDELSVEVKVRDPSVHVPDTTCSVKTQNAWVEQARGLSKTCNIIDDDSDTGLSSLHSQDSDNPPVCESLV
ncbi:ras association domain-containing protein 10-like [Alosa sapidissima]|uniref:ras association domain-containing protein 10-like n=1 Tax=Alosa sapidissima TaxID=34773 RepID=UPI001C09C5F0|nr:ras association domain-containing protein 10-like [Alosa sapidissima]